MYIPSFDGVINIKNFDLMKIKIDGKSCKNTVFYCFLCMTIKDLNYTKMNSLNPLYVNKINGHIEKSNENEYLVLVPLMKVKTQKKYEKMLSKIRDLNRSMTNSSNYFDKNYMKIKFNLIQMMIYLQLWNFRTWKYFVDVFHECNKYVGIYTGLICLKQAILTKPLVWVIVLFVINGIFLR